MTGFDTSVLPQFGLPRTLPGWCRCQTAGSMGRWAG